MKPNADLTTTQRLPVYETMADLVASDPGRYYAHRVRIDHVIDLHKPPREWRIEGLLRLLKAVGMVLAVAGWTFAACDARAECRTEATQAQADLTSGARLLSSSDPVTSLLGYQIMTAARMRLDYAQIACSDSDDRAKPWSDDDMEPAPADPWEAPACMLTRAELDEATAVLGLAEPTCSTVQTAIAGMGRP